MKAGVRLSLLFVFLVMLQTANAQAKTKPVQRKTPAKTTQATQEDPPPMAMPKLSDLLTFDTTAAVDDAFTADVRQLMNTMHFKENLIQTVSGSLDQNTSQLPADFKEEFKKRFLKEFTDGPGMRWMENLFIKTYRRHFTQAEIKELVRFYDTELGKKFIAVSPELTLNIMQDSQKIGQYLGFKVGQEIDNEKQKTKQ